MNDIHDLFDQVARSAATEPSPAVVDADLARGRRALSQFRRRRARRVTAGVAGVAAVAAVVLAAGPFGGSNGSGSRPAPDAAATGTSVGHRTTSTSARPRTTQQPLSVQLVAYSGHQLAGFTVDRVPDGWRLSGSSQFALTIDPPGDTNDNPDVFEGKLTVLLQSQDASGLPAGQGVTVNGHPGVVTDDGGQALTYDDGAGHTVVVQAPDQLAWSNAQIVSFAEGVHVTGNAVAGHG